MALQNKILLAILLCAISLAGNAVTISLFYSVVFIFGSIPALIALRFLGRPYGIFVALVGASYTWYLWGHPYAIVIFTLEVFIVSLIVRRGKNVAVADLIYWVVLGIPLVLFFYQVPLGLPFDPALLIAVKQAINGVFNAAVAAIISSLLLLFLASRSETFEHKISVSEILFNGILFLTITAGAIPIVLDSHKIQQKVEELALKDLRFANHVIQIELKTLEDDWTEQTDSAQVKETFAELDEIIPARDNISYVISSVAHGELARRGTIKSQQGSGTTQLRSDDLLIWKPDGNMPALVRWRESRYVLLAAIPGYEDKISVVIEFDGAAIVSELDGERFSLIVLLGALVFASVIMAYLLSSRFTAPLLLLTEASKNLTAGIMEGKVESLHFPQSRISEYGILSETIEQASSSLSQTFAEIKDVKENLEDIVKARTAEVEKLSMVASQTINGVVITDTDGIVTWVNDGFTRITGYKFDEVLGRKPGNILQGADTDPKTVDTIRTAIKNQEPFHVEIVNYTKEMRPYWLELSCNPIRDSDGTVTGFIAIETDVTERKVLERSKDEFISTVSHELRTPLTSIKGALGLALGGAFGELDDAQTSNLELASRNADRLNFLVNDLLDVQKLKSGSFKLELQSLSVKKLLEDSVRDNNGYADKEKVEFVLDPVDPDLYVMGDRHRLEQVMANLLSNAAKFSSNNDIVEIKAQSKEGMVSISVADNGQGIPDNFKHYIFSAFSQADSSDTKEKGGTGLGLNISEKIIKMHGGHIHYETELNVGTTFFFTVPVADAPKAP